MITEEQKAKDARTNKISMVMIILGVALAILIGHYSPEIDRGAQATNQTESK